MVEKSRVGKFMVPGLKGLVFKLGVEKSGVEKSFNHQGNHLNSYTISLESFGSFRGPLFPKSVTGQELFLLLLTANRLKTFLLLIFYQSDYEIQNF